MAEIELKNGDKVVLYRKDPAFPNIEINTVLTVGDASFRRFVWVKDNNRLGFLIFRHCLRHLRKTDVGAKVVIIPTNALVFHHGFDFGDVVTIIDEHRKWDDGVVLSRAVGGKYGLTQWLHPSIFKLAKEQ